MKSERLKKLEAELEDLEKWLNLGLVPKKDLVKHQEEIKITRQKIREEKERLSFLKENGEAEEYIAPKRTSAKQPYSDNPSIADMDLHNLEEDIEFEGDITFAPDEELEEDEEGASEEGDEDPFSDKNRWKRGILEDPDIDNW
ncbi:MAG: hypothetical protein JW769_01895 [Parachlamydiales bacterium]|nr:hypothetical protein [Parachlamydiales bacterium]